MAFVYLAEDLRHGRKVALKVLRPELGPALGGERFLQEIRVTAKLHHPNILPLFDSGEISGVLYYVMPYVDGETLGDRLRREKQLPVADAVHIATEVANALAFAHRNGVIHRDVKPRNILLQAGEPLVSDFGIALGGTEKTDQRVMGGEHPIGTPEYMSPEQTRGDRTLDERSDVYSLGCVLYEMLVGEPPHTGSTAESVVTKVLGDAPTDIRRRRDTVPPSIERVVQKALAKLPADRFSTAAEFAAALKAGARPTYASGEGTRVIAGRNTRQLLWLAGAAVLIALALVTTLTILRGNGAQIITVGQTRRVTLAEGLELDPAISPNGEMLAYAAGPLGAMKLYVEQAAGGRSVALTGNVPGHHRWPRWSPDGTRIAFVANESGRSTVQIVPALGGPSRVVVQTAGGEGEVFGVAWSPDGRQLAYGMFGGIYTVPVDGGEQRLVADMVDGHSPSWSPDGSKIVFVLGNPTFVFGTFVLGNIAPSSIWVVSASGGDPVQVTEGTFLHMSPVWTPDGKSIVFVSSRAGRRDIYQLELGSTGRAKGEPVRLTTGLNAHTVSLAGDGSALVYSVLDMQANIWSIEIPTRGPVSTLSAQPVTEGNQAIEGLAVSPDGSWVAYDSDMNGTQDIYRLRLGGSEPQQLTDDPRDDFYPAWSPDGTEIAFYSFRTGKRDLWIMDADGANEKQVTSGPGHNRAPQWSPDGQSLVYHSDRTGRSELFIVSREGGPDAWGVPRQITEGGGFNAHWSPDGRFIAYIGDLAVQVISPDGGEPRAVTVPPDDPNAPAPWAVAWSPDSRLVYYKAFDSERHSSFWSVPTTGGTPQLLVTFDNPELQSRRNEFATDGTRFFFTVGVHESDLWVMDLGS
jgi:serine/threonine-protein kinase